jgi:fatty acid desaturase
MISLAINIVAFLVVTWAALCVVSVALAALGFGWAIVVGFFRLIVWTLAAAWEVVVCKMAAKPDTFSANPGPGARHDG